MVLGAGPAAVSVARGLAAAGFAPELHEPDPDAARRLGDLLRQAGVPFPLSCDAGSPLGAALVAEALEEEPLADRRAHLARILAEAEGDVPVWTTLPPPVPAGAIGFRPATPAHLRPLVEIAPGPGVSAAQVDSALALARAMGRQPVSAPGDRASVAMRLSVCLADAAEDLLFEGAIPHELDEAMVAAGWDLGVFEAQDLIGLASLRDPARPRPISDRMVEEGRLGKSAGVGWYRYPGGGGAVIDPLVEDLVREEAWFAGVPQRSFGPEAMLARLRAALRAEVAAVLEEGATAAEIDLVARAGLGFVEGCGLMRWLQES